MGRGGNRQQFQPPVLRKMRAIAIESLQYKNFEPLDAEYLALDGSKKGSQFLRLDRFNAIALVVKYKASL